MKALFASHYAAFVALVLILAAAPSHATERRDPVLNPEQTQPSSGHTTEATKPAHRHFAKKSLQAQAHDKVAQKRNPDSRGGNGSKGK